MTSEKKRVKGGKKSRMIHVRLSEELHKKLRVRTAELDTTIQDWVLELLERALKKKG